MNIEILVRAIIQDKEGKVLLCQRNGKDYYFFPGGHVEWGETAVQALERELKEELDIKVKSAEFIGGSEHQFAEDVVLRQEINLVFMVKPDKITTVSQEGHLKFYLFSRAELKNKKVFPERMKQAVFKWFEDKQTFWQSDL